MHLMVQSVVPEGLAPLDNNNMAFVIIYCNNTKNGFPTVIVSESIEVHEEADAEKKRKL